MIVLKWTKKFPDIIQKLNTEHKAESERTIEEKSLIFLFILWQQTLRIPLKSKRFLRHNFLLIFPLCLLYKFIERVYLMWANMFAHFFLVIPSPLFNITVFSVIVFSFIIFFSFLIQFSHSESSIQFILAHFFLRFHMNQLNLIRSNYSSEKKKVQWLLEPN